jgi:hypothetical protein
MALLFTPIKAEDYIGLWRAAKKSAVSLGSLAKMGINLTATIVKPLQPVLEEIGQEHNASKRHLLDSIYATRTADRICWVFPLDTLESLEAYTLVAGIWVNTQSYPDQVNEITVSASGTAVRPSVSEYDLFAENEVAA